MPLVPLIKKTRTARVTEATMTVIPTLSSDHLSCFWLGKLCVVLRGNHSRYACKSLEADSFRSRTALNRLWLQGENPEDLRQLPGLAMCAKTARRANKQP